MSANSSSSSLPSSSPLGVCDPSPVPKKKRKIRLHQDEEENGDDNQRNGIEEIEAALVEDEEDTLNGNRIDDDIDLVDADHADVTVRKRLIKSSPISSSSPPSSPVLSSSPKHLRPKKDLSAAEKKRIAQVQAEKKSQPTLSNFFGAKSTPSKGSIASFFKKVGAKTEMTKDSDNKTDASTKEIESVAVATVDEDGNITMGEEKSLSSPPASSPFSTLPSSPSTKKPTAGKRKRDADEEATRQSASSVQVKEANGTNGSISMNQQEGEDDKERITTAAAAAAVAVEKKLTDEENVARLKAEAEKKAEAERAQKEKEKAKEKEKEKVKEKVKSKEKEKALDTDQPASSASSSSSSSKSSKTVLSSPEGEDEMADLGSSDNPRPSDDGDVEDEDDWEKETDAALHSADSSADYDPVKAATWKIGADVPFAALAAVFERLEGERSRLLTVAWLSDFFRSVIATSPHQLVTCVYLACNQIAPAYEGERTNVGDSILIRAIADATGKKPAQLSKDFKSSGDLGEVALNSRGSQSTLGNMFGARPKPLMCRGVFDMYRIMADTSAPGMSGKGSQDVRASKIKSLLVACQGAEAKYIVRGLQGNLRIHMAEKGVISALARAVTLTPPSLNGTLPPPIIDIRKTTKKEEVQRLLERNIELVNQAYIELPNHRKVIECILKYGVEELPNKVFLEPGIPVKVMLGKPCNGVLAILEKFGTNKFTLEYKYDGARCQIHMLDDGTIKMYSRNSQSDTEKYPDLVRDLPKAFNTEVIVKKDEDDGQNATASNETAAVEPFEMKNFIIDCEVVAWDRVAKKILPFQTLTTRKKKDVSDENITVQVCLFGFDLLFMNGVSYMNQPLVVRRDVLRRHFHQVDDLFYFAIHKDTADADEIGEFMQQAIRDSCEGLMVKSLEVDANYVPNKRNWFKLKKDYMDGVADTLDLVVIGAWHGKGKRTGGYGAFLLATFDPDTEDYQSICALGTGLSDKDLDRFSQQHVEATDDAPEIPAYFQVIDQPPRYYKYPSNGAPDVWFEPTRVWEIKCADLSISPSHYAAMGHPELPEGKGIALRFPRLKGERTDKSVPQDLTQADQVVDLFQSQSVQGGTGGRPGGGR